MNPAGSSKTDSKIRYAGIDVRNVMMNSTPKIRPCLWSSFICGSRSFPSGSASVKDDLAHDNRRLKHEATRTWLSWLPEVHVEGHSPAQPPEPPNRPSESH